MKNLVVAARCPTRLACLWESFVHVSVVLRIAFKCFHRTRMYNHSAALTFFLILSIIPTLALLTTVVEQLARVAFIREELRQFVDYLSEYAYFDFISVRENLSNSKRLASVGIIGFVLLSVASRLMVYSTVSTFSIIFRQKVYTTFQYWGASLFIIPFLVVVLTLSMAIEIVKNMATFVVTNLPTEILDNVPLLYELVQEVHIPYVKLISLSASLLLMTIIYMPIYLWLSPVGTSRRLIFLLSITLSVINIGVQKVMSVLLVLPAITIIYGSMSSAVVLMVYIYVLALLFYLFACIINIAHRPVEYLIYFNVKLRGMFSRKFLARYGIVLEPHGLEPVVADTFYYVYRGNIMCFDSDKKPVRTVKVGRWVGVGSEIRYMEAQGGASVLLHLSTLDRAIFK